MSLNTLRSLDITNPEDEGLVQQAIDERVVDMPLEVSLNIPASFTDNLTPEKEKTLQEKIDKKIATLKASRQPKKDSAPSKVTLE